MILADDIRNGCGTAFDLGGVATSITKAIEGAQRFVLRDDAARACGELSYSRPSTLNAALPICRLPYSTIWVENRGGLGKYEAVRPLAPVPLRQGMLVEAIGDTRQVGCISLAWVHRSKEENIIEPTVCPFAVYFDWRSDGDVGEVMTTAAEAQRRVFKADWLTMIYDGLAAKAKAQFNYAWTQARMRETQSLAGWANDPKEVEAIRVGYRHLRIGVCPHAIGFLNEMIEYAPAQRAKTLLDNWLADVAGEGPFAECFIAMLNSRNPCLDQTPTDLSRLNKARTKQGKQPFFEHIETRIALSRRQQRYAQRHGLSEDHPSVRGTTVRGHFKIRGPGSRGGGGGVYWWHEHDRGDQANRVDRDDYQVVA